MENNQELLIKKIAMNYLQDFVDLIKHDMSNINTEYVYNQGLYNGMEKALSILEQRDFKPCLIKESDKKTKPTLDEAIGGETHRSDESIYKGDNKGLWSLEKHLKILNDIVEENKKREEKEYSTFADCLRDLTKEEKENASNSTKMWLDILAANERNTVKDSGLCFTNDMKKLKPSKLKITKDQFLFIMEQIKSLNKKLDKIENAIQCITINGEDVESEVRYISDDLLDWLSIQVGDKEDEYCQTLLTWWFYERSKLNDVKKHLRLENGEIFKVDTTEQLWDWFVKVDEEKK